MTGPRKPPRFRLACATCLVALTLAPDVSAAPPLPTPPTTPNPSFADAALEPDGGGRWRHRGDGFTAIVHPDGSVEFRDHDGTADVNLLGLDPLHRRILDPEPEHHDPAWMAVLERTFFPGVQRLGPSGRVPVLASLGGRFGGLADGRRKDRHMGAKRAFLASTEALRLRMANRWYTARLQDELAALGGQLTAIWRDTKLPLAERKRRIFERWVDCEDPGTNHRSELDAMRLAIARSARAKIEAFVRQVAPHGSSRAYTRAELDRYNRSRAGKPHFRPYDPPDPLDPPVMAPDGFAEPEVGTSDAPPLPARPSEDPAPAPTQPFGPDPGPGWLRPSRAPSM